MPTLRLIPFPLPSNGPPAEFAYDQRSISQISNTTYMKEALTAGKDSWKVRCQICGFGGCGIGMDGPCYIIPNSEDDTWADLKRKNYIPKEAKSAKHEPRNSMVLCPNHRHAFKNYTTIVRFVPKERKYVFFDFRRYGRDIKYHGKAINLNADDRHAPFPAALLIHEQRARGFCPFYQEPDDIPEKIQFQDWMAEENKISSTTGGNIGNQGTVNFATPGNSSGGPAPGFKALPPLNEHTIHDIVTATRESESWKACVLEGTSWNGTAEENAEKYRRIADL